MNYELYRRSAPGQALTDALDELIQNQQITPQLAMRVLFQYDKAISDALNSTPRGRCSIKVRLLPRNPAKGHEVDLRGGLKLWRLGFPQGIVA